MVSLYFGLPGCGKTTMLAKLAYDAVKKGKYDNVYSNVALNMPGVTYIDNECIGKYNICRSLVLIDEATLFADSRAYKNFDREKLEFFLLHRHYQCDIILFTQQWDGVDRKIRVITDRVYYIYKTWLTAPWISKCYRIPYGILIPDPNKTGEKLGEIIQGYSRPPWYIRLFAVRVYRPKYYKYFDSWEAPELKPLPDKYQPVPGDPWEHNTIWLLPHWHRDARRLQKDRRRARRRELYGRIWDILWRW